MLTPIRPSLSQVLLRPGPTAGQTGPATNNTGPATGDPALTARQAFFRAVQGESQGVPSTTPQTQPHLATQAPQVKATPRPVTPSVFKAADIERAQSQAEAPPPLRPGSLLNIVV